MGFINKLADSEDYTSLSNKLRNKRFAFFEQRLRKWGESNVTILDIGGTTSYWLNREYHVKENITITLLNLKKENKVSRNIKSIVGDATDLSAFKENEFDIVFSNSVIEHLFTYENQERMAKEVQRVGKHHFIQTPNKYFVIEPHYVLPFFQFYPKWLQLFLLTKTKIVRGVKVSKEVAENHVNEIRLLDMKEFKKLFPSSKIYKEKLLGMIKSFTAYDL